MQQHSPPNIRNLIAACSAISVFGLAFGMTYPLLSLILEQRGVSTEMIGINSAMMPVGILLFSPLIPVVSKRFGAGLWEWRGRPLFFEPRLQSFGSGLGQCRYGRSSCPGAQCRL